MNALLWSLQIVLGLYFVAIGGLHFVVPAGLPDALSWMYALPAGLHAVSGGAEILGGLGLILPGLLRVRTGLTPWAALGLALVMVGAAVWHVGRGEYGNLVGNGGLFALTAFLAYARWRLRPLRGRPRAPVDTAPSRR